MSISRDTFNPDANYKRVRYHQDRDLLDSELNEQQDILHLERKKIADQIFKEGSVIAGLTVSITDNVLSVADGLVYIDGSIEAVPGAILTFDSAVDSGADYVYVELLKYNYGLNHDAALINPATGEPTAEREKWVLALKDHDASDEALPNNVTERKVVPIYKFDRRRARSRPPSRRSPTSISGTSWVRCQGTASPSRLSPRISSPSPRRRG